MGPIETGVLGLACLVGVIMLHVPVGIAMAAVGGAAYLYMTGDAFGMLSLFGTETVNMLTNKDFAVVMSFLLMGGFAGAAGISSDIYRVANAWIGHWKGGLAMATVLGCAGFGAIAGSSIATAATMTKIAMPEMEKRNYALSLCAGTLAAGGTLGSLIPPSIITCFSPPSCRASSPSFCSWWRSASSSSSSRSWRAGASARHGPPASGRRSAAGRPCRSSSSSWAASIAASSPSMRARRSVWC
jgi:hypothetical protein